MVENLKLIHWFRNDLRLHDSPSIVSGLKECSIFYPVYIFDELVSKENISFNRLQFILEALQDIDQTLEGVGGKLHLFHGKPVEILQCLFRDLHITHLSYEEDPSPTWKSTEAIVLDLCREFDVKVMKETSHTLWNPSDIVRINRGQPPVTYSVFCHVVECLGPPPHPAEDLNFSGIQMPKDAMSDIYIPLLQDYFGVNQECNEKARNVWIGGETRALEHLAERLLVEEEAILTGVLMPNQSQPDLLGPPMSMSAALSLGCLSVRKFYWSLHNLQDQSDGNLVLTEGLMGQLIWREYFYAMSLNNPNYGHIHDNPICLNVPWIPNDHHLQCWTEGKTGYPFIDAAMRQLKQEGWIHHVARNAVACFLTRGDLWISWEEGFKVFMKYLIDADFAVCAGNWMWISSSAFENILQCSSCISPTLYARRFEPSGSYIRKYVPELAKFSSEYIFEPWLAPISVQQEAACVIGQDYPHPIVDHQSVSERNTKWMEQFRSTFLSNPKPLHCAPSCHEETRFFMWLPEKCIENLPSV